MPDTKLLPCPFGCAIPPVLRHYQRGSFATDYWVACSLCGVAMTHQCTPVAAVAAWNARAPHPAAEGLAKALEAVQLQLLQSNNDTDYAQEANELARAAVFEFARNVALRMR